jgi:WD40 repeat protein
MGQTPILCSSDDVGCIRLWNIKTFQCVQCLSYGRRTLILRLLDISERGLMCFLGSRLNIIKLDDRASRLFNDNHPIRIEFNARTEELIVTTRRDLQFVNVHTGRVRRIFRNLVDEEDEIVQLRPVNHFNRFVMGDSRGNLGLFNMGNGTQLKQLRHSANDITNLRLDITNNIVISTSWDHLVIQHLDSSS